MVVSITLAAGTDNCVSSVAAGAVTPARTVPSGHSPVFGVHEGDRHYNGILHTLEPRGLSCPNFDGIGCCAAERPSATATPTRTSRPVPDVAGKSFGDARKTLNQAGFYGGAWGKDGKKWTTAPEDSVVVNSTTPAAGEVTDTEDIEIHVGLTEAENTAAVNTKADAAKATADTEVKAAEAAERAAVEPEVTGLAATLPAKFPGYPRIVDGPASTTGWQAGSRASSSMTRSSP